MILFIDTADNKIIRLEIRRGREIMVREEIGAEYAQGEKLLPAIRAMFREDGIDAAKIERIVVENRGKSFTALRVGVVTANALGYALGIPVSGVGGGKARATGKERKEGGAFGPEITVVRPDYGREPNITARKERI